MEVTSAYIQSPYQVQLRKIDLPDPAPDEALIDVLGCGICGYDLEIGGSLAPEPRPFGHEIVGVVRRLGSAIRHVRVGDQVALESSSFCGDCADCRNGRVDLCNRGAGHAGGQCGGFSESMLAPGRCLVPAPDISPMHAVLTEPCGVAIDVVNTAEIGLTDRVLVVGAGAIGLMITAIARRSTTGLLAVADNHPERLAKARGLGADLVISPAETPIDRCGDRVGGFDRILVSARPQVLPACITAAAYGAYIVYIGSDFVNGGVVPLDTHALHFGKKQLRPSFASPALYFPQALHLLRSGVVPAEQIVTHRYPLSRIQEALQTARSRSDAACKVVVIPDACWPAMGKESN